MPVPTATAAAGVDIFIIHPSMSSKALFNFETILGSAAKEFVGNRIIKIIEIKKKRNKTKYNFFFHRNSFLK